MENFNLSPETKEQLRQMKIRMNVIGKCAICLTPLEVRDVRKQQFCAAHQYQAGMIKRYQSKEKGILTEAERLRILNEGGRPGKNWNE